MPNYESKRRVLTLCPNLLEEQLPDRALKLGRDSLWLHADLHLRDLRVSVGLEGTGKETTECGLSCTVLAHHDKDPDGTLLVGSDTEMQSAKQRSMHRVDVLGVSEGAGFDLQVELALSLLHGWVAEGTSLIVVELV